MDVHMGPIDIENRLNNNKMANTSESETKSRGDDQCLSFCDKINNGDDEQFEEEGYFSEDEEENKVDEDDFYANLDPQLLLEEGKKLRKEKKYDEAIIKLYWALTNKMNLLGITEESGIDPRLSEFYLVYADSLLEKEENSNNLFSKEGAENQMGIESTLSSSSSSFSSSSSSSSCENHSSAEQGTIAPTVQDVPYMGSMDGTDEEIAWENFEAAKLAYIKLIYLKKRGDFDNYCNGIVPDYLSDLFSPESIECDKFEELLKRVCVCDDSERSRISEKEVIDLSYVFIRLGDILQLAEKYIEASVEYKNSLFVLESFNFPEDTFESPLICLAQSTLFSGKVRDSKAMFERAYRIIENHLKGENGMKAPEKQEQIDTYKLTLEDLQLTLDDINKRLAINPEDQKPVTSIPKLDEIKKENSFSESQFSESEPVKVINATDINISRENATDSGKKRRIDLSKI